MGDSGVTLIVFIGQYSTQRVSVAIIIEINYFHIAT